MPLPKKATLSDDGGTSSTIGPRRGSKHPAMSRTCTQTTAPSEGLRSTDGVAIGLWFSELIAPASAVKVASRRGEIRGLWDTVLTQNRFPFSSGSSSLPKRSGGQGRLRGGHQISSRPAESDTERTSGDTPLAEAVLSVEPREETWIRND